MNYSDFVKHAAIRCLNKKADGYPFSALELVGKLAMTIQVTKVARDAGKVSLYAIERDIKDAAQRVVAEQVAS